MDIVVTFPKGDIDHWNEKVSYSYIAEQEVWWNMRKLPNNFSIDDKLFIVMDNEVRGFFEVKKIKFGDINKVFLKNFKSIKSIAMKGFQGFRYRRFEFEEEYE